MISFLPVLSSFLSICLRPPPRHTALFFLASRQLTSMVHTGQVGTTIYSDRGSCGIPELASSCITTPLFGEEERKRERGERCAFSFRCVWNLFLRSRTAHTRREGSMESPLALTLSNSTRCILTAVLSPHHMSHSPVARHRNQILNKERPTQRHEFAPSTPFASFSSKADKKKSVISLYDPICFDNDISF